MEVMAAVKEIHERIHNVCSEMKVSGDMRDKRKEWTRADISYTPLTESRRLGPFGMTTVDLCLEQVEWLSRTGFFEKGAPKTYIHKSSGLPVVFTRTVA